VGPQNVLEQAKRYARGANGGPGNWDGLRVPFLYSSNGELVWFFDARDPKKISRQTADFHTADALSEAFAKNRQASFNWFVDNPIEEIARLRPYQQQAIFETERVISNGRRDLLLAMATGTGKTYMTVAQVYRLLESRLVRRILFLVDRKALAAQAVREFAAFNTPKGRRATRITRRRLERWISRFTPSTR